MYHPRDTVTLWKKADKSQVDNNWYKIHYFQRKRMQGDNKGQLQKIYGPVHPSRLSQEVLDQYLEIQLRSLLDCAGTHEIKIYQGHLADLVLPGLGVPHVQETALTLHQLYGSPYISGSSLKGAVRNWALQAFFEGEEEKAAVADSLAGDFFRTIFGTQDQRGRVQFYDVFFMNCEIIPEIMTVHFRRYYEGKSPPTDQEDPMPIAFYGVKGRARVILTLEKLITNPPDLLKVAGSWTVKALSELGVGSKTALGYGRFADVEDVTGELLAELAQAKELEMQKEQKTRAKEQVERMLASLSRGERLAYEISSLGQDERDQERSKGELYQEFLSLSRDDQIVAARALKEYWIKSGDWQKPSKKQKEKNIFLLRLLEST